MSFITDHGLTALRGVRMVDPPSLADHAAQWLIQPSGALEARTIGEPITAEMLEALEARVSDLRRMDDSRGGHVVLDWAGHDLRWATELLLRASYDLEAGRRLHVIVAELAQLAGWLACDAGRHAIAHRYWLTGLRAAHTAGDDALGANIVSCLSYQATWLDHAPDAVHLIHVALSGARHLEPGRLPALLHSREARALALAGDRPAAQRALDAAQASYAEGPPDQPPWTYWISEAVLAADAGRAWLDLGEPTRAEVSLGAGLRMFGDAQPRNRMLHHASLAEARLRRGEVHGAADAAHAALDLAGTMASQRAIERFANLADSFGHFDAVAAREVADRIRTLSPRSHPDRDTG
jgi:hypothetical protein